MEWSSKISSCALSTMHKKKFNHKQLLPLTEDLLILTKFLNQEIERLKNKLSLDVVYKTWRALASCTLARIILFNKKRSGEAAKMTVEQYATRPTFKEQGTQELFASLSPLEKNLASTMEVVDIEGKRGRRVPVIITPELKSAIDLLIKTRSTVNISKNNPYIFAPAESEIGHLRGHDCLKSMCNEVNLQHPEYITGTKLRKYIATVSQIFNLGKNEADWLARHLGHDIRVHRDFYRLHENAVEATKISRLLIAIEHGDANKYAGKSLNEINIEDLPCLEEESEEVALPADAGEGINNTEDTSSDDEIPLSNIKEQVFMNQGKRKSSATEEELISTKKETQVKKRKKEKQSAKTLKTTQKTPWTSEEIKSVMTFFKFDLKKELLPGKQKCEECKSKYPVLERRKWTDIKFYLKNYYSRNKRLINNNDNKLPI
ncbi:uncharacterized protein LOC126889627 [Diabrotica virgifera virgifera]|nr:uncharacterized protein LOC126889627 [Diabrotica virgifera virgifera]